MLFILPHDIIIFFLKQSFLEHSDKEDNIALVAISSLWHFETGLTPASI